MSSEDQWVDCEECGAEILIEDSYNDEDGTLCEDCHSEKYGCCEQCGEECLRDDMLSYEHDSYCEDCFDEKFSTCDDCGDVVLADYTSTTSGRGVICDDCRDSYYSFCEDCEEYVHNDYIRTVQDGYRYVCDSCCDYNYYYCENCEEYQHNEDPCSCRDSSEYGLEQYDYSPDSYQYNKTEDERKFSQKTGRKPLYLGWELETEAMNGATPADVLDCTGHLDYLYCKEDGSLDYGCEIVSHPSTLAFFKTQKDSVNDMLRGIARTGARSYSTDTCGMHVHLSRRSFTTLHLYKFMKMVYDCPTMTLKISQRERSQLCEWASVTDEDSSDVLAKTKTYENGTAGRYVAVNLQNRHTVELRIFRGTLKCSSFWKNLEYAHALHAYTAQCSVKECTVLDFLEWLEKNVDNYTNLAAFLNVPMGDA